jgi:hypothetical protein
MHLSLLIQRMLRSRASLMPRWAAGACQLPATQCRKERWGQLGWLGYRFREDPAAYLSLVLAKRTPAAP